MLYEEFYNQKGLTDHKLRAWLADVLTSLGDGLAKVFTHVDKGVLHQLLANHVKGDTREVKQAEFGTLAKLASLVPKDCDEGEEDNVDLGHEIIRLREKVKKLAMKIQYQETEIKHLRTIKVRFDYSNFKWDGKTRMELSKQSLNNLTKIQEAIICPNLEPESTCPADFSNFQMLKKMWSDLIDLWISLQVPSKSTSDIITSKPFKKLFKQGKDLLLDYNDFQAKYGRMRNRFQQDLDHANSLISSLKKREKSLKKKLKKS